MGTVDRSSGTKGEASDAAGRRVKNRGAGDKPWSQFPEQVEDEPKAGGEGQGCSWSHGGPEEPLDATRFSKWGPELECAGTCPLSLQGLLTLVRPYSLQGCSSSERLCFSPASAGPGAKSRVGVKTGQWLRQFPACPAGLGEAVPAGGLSVTVLFRLPCWSGGGARRGPEGGS